LAESATDREPGDVSGFTQVVQNARFARQATAHGDIAGARMARNPPV